MKLIMESMHYRMYKKFKRKIEKRSEWRITTK
jgi:hypothetical protein